MSAHREPFFEDESIDLRALWGTLIRNKWGIITLPLLLAMLAYLYSSTLTPVYRASSTLLIEPDTGNVVGIPGIESLSASQEYLQTQFELLKSRDLAEHVVRNLDLVNHPYFDPANREEPLIDWRQWTDWRHWVTVLGLEQLIILPEPEVAAPPTAEQRVTSIAGAIRSATAIAPRSGTQLVDIRVEMTDRVLAADVANAIAAGYIERQLEGRLAMTEQATAWMSQRLTELKDQLDVSEQQLQAYVESENLVNMNGITTVEASELTQINNRLVEARQAFARAENQFSQIARVTDAGWREQVTVPVVRSNELVSQFLAAEAEARTRVDELSQRYGPRHPAMIEAQDELNAAGEALRSQVEQVIASIEQDFELAQANLQSLESAFDRNRDAILEVQRKEFEFRELQRNVDTNRTLYDTFLNRLKETSATADIDDANARIVETALVPGGAFKPQTARNTLIAAVLAFMAAIGLALLREQFDNRVRSSAEVEEKLRLPMIGLLPLQKRRTERRQLARLYHADTDRTFSEAVRTIRTGVVLSGLDNPHKLMVITSSVPGEGKTTLASNLASAMGQMERVLLLEADMRKPSFRQIFGFDKEVAGLADLVADDVPLEKAIRSLDGLDVMPCGSVPPNPLELLSSQRFGQILDQLRERYDRIIVDAPPVQAVSDPLVLSTHADTLLYVVKADATPVPLVKKGIDRLAEVRAPLAGIVLDQVDVRKSRRYGYSYGYKYDASGYYDYYGYSTARR